MASLRSARRAQVVEPRGLVELAARPRRARRPRTGRRGWRGPRRAAARPGLPGWSARRPTAAPPRRTASARSCGGRAGPGRGRASGCAPTRRSERPWPSSSAGGAEHAGVAEAAVLAVEHDQVEGGQHLGVVAGERRLGERGGQRQRSPASARLAGQRGGEGALAEDRHAALARRAQARRQRAAVDQRASPARRPPARRCAGSGRARPRRRRATISRCSRRARRARTCRRARPQRPRRSMASGGAGFFFLAGRLRRRRPWRPAFLAAGLGRGRRPCPGWAPAGGALPRCCGAARPSG